MAARHRTEAKARDFGLRTPAPAESHSLQPPWRLSWDPQRLSLWLPEPSGGRNQNVKTAILGKTGIPRVVPSCQQWAVL